MTSDESFMRRALAVAKQKGTDPACNAIGCVIVLDGQVLATAHNMVAETNDATAHAEIVALRAAGNGFENGELRGATLYTTLQPCGMCTMASIWAKIGRIVYGAGREDVHHMYFEARAVDTVDFVAKAYRDDIAIEGGIDRAGCAALYYGPNDNPPTEQQGNL
jgi:tRNA(adenine34) deaminase